MLAASVVETYVDSLVEWLLSETDRSYLKAYQYDDREIISA